MAANMPQMGGGGPPRNRPQTQQLTQLVYTQLMTNNVQPNNWHAQVPISVRVGGVMNLITNSFLAMPQLDSQHIVQHQLAFERDAYSTSPDKATYDQKMNGRFQELFKKRQANQQNLHHTLNVQQAQAQAQAQARAQMMMNPSMQMGGMGQPQPGFQHLQQQMQPSPIPQQNQQPGMGMNNPNGMPMNPNQQAMHMGGQVRPQLPPQATLASLSPQDRAKVTQLAMTRLQNTPEPQRNQLRAMLQQKLNPQQLAQLQAEGQDPVLYFMSNQILQASKGNQGAMQMQAQHRQMNQAGQQMTGGPNGEFSPFGVESIMNQQKAGLLAQEAGQMVVPASNGPGRNATPQPIGGMPGPNQGPNQPGMPYQMGQPFGQRPPQQIKMDQQAADQQAAQSQAQIRAQAQAKQMQGQPGGLNGAGAVSQSPAMNTLNAPVRRPPMGVGQGDGHPQMNNGQFGQMLDPRFNQGAQRPQMGANPNVNRSQIMNAMLAQMTNESRQQFMSLPPDKMNEMMMKWQASRAAQMAGRQQPQPGQLGPGNNPMAQFSPGTNSAGQPPNQAMGINPQNQMMLQQQLNRMRPNMPGQNPQANVLMENMDVPLKILEQLRSTHLQGLPPDTKKWGQLKRYVAGKPLPPNFTKQLSSVQQQQFQSLLQRSAAAQGQQISQPNMLQQGVQGPNGQMPGQPNANLGNGMPPINISPQEVAMARNSERFKNVPEDKVRMYLMQLKMHQLQNRAAGQISSGQAPPISQAGSVITPTPAQSSTINGQPAQPPPPPPPQQQQQQQSTGSNANAGGVTNSNAQNKQAQNNRPSQTTPAPPQQKNNLKRASPDDVVEVSNVPSGSANRPASQQQPGTSGAAPQLPQLTPQQIAAMNPQQRQRYEQMMKARQANAAAQNSEEMQRLKAIGQEQHLAAAQEPLKDIPMTPEQYHETSQKIQAMVGEMTKLSKVLGRWYSVTRDDNRARMFFKMRLRLIKQFQDGEKSPLKDTFSVSQKELDGFWNMLESMAKDVAAMYPQGFKKNANQSNTSEVPQGAPGQAATTPSQPAPLNAANLEKQTQALSKMHQRSGSRSGQPPAAPTTSQPPFSFSAQSPSGQPAYAGKPSITQDHLQLPARKKAKTSGVGSGGASANASPNAQKLPSPEMSKRPTPAAEAKPPQPQFLCPDTSCDYHVTGFATQEALRKHNEQEHIKPAKDPIGYVEECLAEALGLDANGNPKPAPIGQPSVSPMASEPSKQGQTHMVRTEMMPLMMGGNGAISDMNVYRSITPKDTPESSKDGLSSEANSDLSEGVTLNVSLDMGFDTWRPFNDVQFGEFDATDYQVGDLGSMGDTVFPEFLSWDTVPADFEKKFSLDSSLYSLDTST
ncbi:hypothetical protein F5Y15DRAFT_107796 [Xylariaceae sp. FL0016]|nr:hypothetical protein F5Y15DRAFT_107796 [Xylariaceae sp. FL0016]